MPTPQNPAPAAPKAPFPPEKVIPLAIENMQAISRWYEAKDDSFAPSVILRDVAYALTLATKGAKWTPQA